MGCFLSKEIFVPENIEVLESYTFINNDHETILRVIYRDADGNISDFHDTVIDGPHFH